jgi:hypothetical protein
LPLASCPSGWGKVETNHPNFTNIRVRHK